MDIVVEKAFVRIEKSYNRVFVIGDVHGCVKELTRLLTFLEDKQGLSQEDLVVFVGDYIDRGPDSKGVIDLVIKFKEKFSQTVFLRGNHEDMLLDYLGFDGEGGDFYLRNGGDSFFESYRLNPVDLASNLVRAMPESHIEFFRNLERFVIFNDFIVAHAGLNPLREILDQQNEDLFWIREDFIDNEHYFEKTVIFGHTPYEEIFVDMPYKIGIDTGLVYGNKLTCLEFYSKKVFQIEAGDKKVRETAYDFSEQEELQVSK